MHIVSLTKVGKNYSLRNYRHKNVIYKLCFSIYTSCFPSQQRHQANRKVCVCKQLSEGAAAPLYNCSGHGGMSCPSMKPYLTNSLCGLHCQVFNIVGYSKNIGWHTKPSTFILVTNGVKFNTEQPHIKTQGLKKKNVFYLFAEHYMEWSLWENFWVFQKTNSPDGLQTCRLSLLFCPCTEAKSLKTPMEGEETPQAMLCVCNCPTWVLLWFDVVCPPGVHSVLRVEIWGGVGPREVGPGEKYLSHLSPHSRWTWLSTREGC